MISSLFRIGAEDFDIVDGRLTGHFDYETFRWSIFVASLERYLCSIDENWAPCAFIQRLKGVTNLSLNRWQDVISRDVFWTEFVEPGSPVENGCISVVSESFPIQQSVIRFSTGAKDAMTFGMAWSGSCNLPYGDRDEILPFMIETNMKFEGIEVAAKNEREAKEGVMPFLPVQEYIVKASRKDGFIWLCP